MTEQNFQPIEERLKGIPCSVAKDAAVEIAKGLASKGLSVRQAEAVLDYAKDLLKDIRLEKPQD